MKDFKRMHKSNWPTHDDSHPSIWESIAGGMLIGVLGTALLLFAFIQATGGF